MPLKMCIVFGVRFYKTASEIPNHILRSSRILKQIQKMLLVREHDNHYTMHIWKPADGGAFNPA